MNTADHAPGIILDTPTRAGAGIFLRYVEQRVNSRGRVIANRAQYGIHVFRLKTDDNRGFDPIATLRIIRHSDGTLLRERTVRKLEFHAVDTYQDFLLRYFVPAGGARVRYQIEWSGAEDLWVDRIRAHDNHGYRLFAGDSTAVSRTTWPPMTAPRRTNPGASTWTTSPGGRKKTRAWAT